MQKLSVVIPAYNEKVRIEKTLIAINDFLIKQPFKYEIIVVDDGSKDGTEAVVKKLLGSIANLRLIDNQENHGKGFVTRQGMLEATGDVRLFMDADNSTKVDEVLKMIPEFNRGADIVVGSRRIQGSVITVHQPWIRDFLGGVFRLIVHILVPLGVTDSQCGFKAFSARAVEKIFPQQTIFRWAFDVELLAIAKKDGFTVKEVPITWVNDTESHVKLPGMIKMLIEVIEVRLNLWFGKYK